MTLFYRAVQSIMATKTGDKNLVKIGKTVSIQ